MLQDIQGIATKVSHKTAQSAYYHVAKIFIYADN